MMRFDPGQLPEFLEQLDSDRENIERASESLKENFEEYELLLHRESKSAEDSAAHTGFEQSEIVKTLVFVGEGPVAVLCPGNLRVSTEKLGEVLGEEAEMAEPSEVKTSTGYRIGAVSPFDLDIPVYAERRMMSEERVKPAAGSRFVGAVVEPEELVDAVEAEVVDVAEE